MSDAIKAVGFDLGGVTVHDIGPYYDEYIAEQFAISPTRVREGLDRCSPGLERGELTLEQFWVQFMQYVGVDYPLEAALKIWTYHYSDQAAERPEILKLADRLRGAGYRVGLLSNINVQHAELVRTRSILEHFDAYCFSSEIGARKPEPAAYQALMRALGVGAAELIFIDDLPANVAGAEQLGITAILFQGYAPLVKRLAELGVKT